MRERRPFADPGRRRRGVPVQLLDGAGRRRPGRRLRQIERLQHELAHLEGAATPHVLRAREIEAIPGARHAHVEQPPLLLEVEIARGQRVLDQRGRHLDGLAAPDGGEAPLDAVDHEHDRPLEPLGLVHGEHVHGGRVGIGLGHRRVLAGVDEGVEVVDELADGVVREHPRGVAHPAEELADVLHLLLQLGGRGGVAAHEAGVGEEQVQELAGGRLPRQLHVALQVLGQARDGHHALVRQLDVVGHLAEHVEQPPVAAVGVGRALRQVHDGHLVDVRGRQVVQADRVVRMRHRAEEGDEQAHLRTAVEAGVARERPRDPAHVERAQERIGVVVRPHEDREVAIGAPALALARDGGGDPVRLARHGVERQVLRRAPEARRPVRPERHEPLVHALRDLEPVRVVVPDQPVGRVEDGLGRPAILPQHDRARVGIGPAEVEDVAHRRAAEAEDGLVVVTDHRDAPVPRGEQLHHLELGVVRVLELVDEDVPEALLVAAEDVRPGAQEAQRLDDLVAEVDLPRLDHEALHLRVRARELQVALRLGARRVVRGLREEGLGVRHVFLRRHVLVLEPAQVAHDRMQVARRVAQGPIVPEREREQVLAQEDHLLGAREDPEVRRQAQLERVLADQPIAEGVERGDGHVGVAVGDERVHPLFHLGRRLVGEREREDLGGARPARGDEPGDAAGDDGGLARPRARDDQERTALVRDRVDLGRAQALQNRSSGGVGHRRLLRVTIPPVGQAGEPGPWPGIRVAGKSRARRGDGPASGGPPARAPPGSAGQRRISVLSDASSSSSSARVTRATSPQIVHLSAASAVAASTASCGERPSSVAHRSPAANASPCAQAIDRLDRVQARGPDHGAAGQDRAAGLPERERDRRPRRERVEPLEDALGRSLQAEHRLQRRRSRRTGSAPGAGSRRSSPAPPVGSRAARGSSRRRTPARPLPRPRRARAAPRRADWRRGPV